MQEIQPSPEAQPQLNLPPLRTLLLQAVRLVVVMTVITGVLYPLILFVLSQAVFPTQANGSLITVNGQVIGAQWIGQNFDDPRYFWGRPSFTSPTAYNASASSGSNYGMNDPRLIDAVQARIAALRAADPDNIAPVPIDLVTGSGSGLDPHISPAAARYQVARIARVRALSIEQVNSLVNSTIESRQLGILGEPRVNVVTLNQRLDQLTTQ